MPVNFYGTCFGWQRRLRGSNLGRFEGHDAICDALKAIYWPESITPTGGGGPAGVI